MNDSKPNKILASDLDGTLIPLSDSRENKTDLRTLSKLIRDYRVTLVFVTGRHIESVSDAIREFDLPQPDWIISDVGAAVCRNSSQGWRTVTDYQRQLRDILGRETLLEFHSHFADSTIMRLQETAKQSDFKMSFYTDADHLESAKSLLDEELTNLQINGTIIASVDPFNGDGLLDVLPLGVSKAFALQWLVNHQSLNSENVVFAGDSGNDLTAMISGYKTVVVGNAELSLIEKVRSAHSHNGWGNRLHVAETPATSGVLEGCRAFDLFIN